MALICPFISTNNGVLNTQNCLQDQCQLWDGINNECSIKINALANSHTSSKIDQLVTDNTNTLKPNSDIIKDHVLHIHNEHLHHKTHVCCDISIDCGDIFMGGKIPYANLLIMEYMGGEDLDTNGEIYGKDFGIVDEASKPNIFNSIEATPDWPDPVKLVHWDDLLSYYYDKSNPNPL